MQKTVLFVITKSNYGGAQRYVYDLATRVHRYGYTPLVALGGTGGRMAKIGTLAERLTQAGVKVIPIRHFMRDVSPVEDVRAFIELVQIIRSTRPHIVHVTSSKAGGLGALAARLAGTPRIVFTSHGLTFDESWRPWWQRSLIKLFTWGTMLLAHESIMISQETYDRARSLPFLHTKIALVYNGIETPAYLPREEARAALAKAGGVTLKDGVFLGTIAELHPNKNLHMLIDALSLLMSRGSVVPHLFILGEGEMRSALNELAQRCGLTHHVHLLGYVPDASRYLSALDIFVLPSAKEGLPYVLMEAGLASLPVIASNISGNRDIIVHEESGLLVDPHAQAIADAILQYVDDHSRAVTHGENLRERLQTLFSIDTMLADTVRTYACSKPGTS